MCRRQLTRAHLCAAFFIVFTIAADAQTMPAAPLPVTPANGAVNQPVSLTLTWGSAAGAASYEVQVALSSAFTTTIFDQSGATLTSAAITGLVNSTLYYWRANASDSGDTGWSAVQSFTTIPAVPAPPVLTSPATGSVNQPLTVDLSWTSVTAAASYDVEASTDVNFGSTVFNQSGISGTAATLGGLANNTTYYWRADAANAGGTGPWSGIWIFTTIVAAPAAPALTTPPGGSVNQPLSVNLSWSTSAGAASYEVEVSLASAFGTTLFDQSGTGLTTATVAGLANGTTYFWRANASNAGGKTWSNAASFTTVIAPPAAPVLGIPTNGAGNQSLSIILSWGSVSTATAYEVELSMSSTFGTTIFDQAGVPLTSATVIGLANGTTYYWRANATNIGGTGVWAAVASFTTVVAAPQGPVLASPTNGVADQPLSLTLSWGSVVAAASYGVQIATDVNFGTTVFGQSGLAVTTATTGGLANNVQYYWRASASNVSGTGWSGVWIFTTIPSAPAAPPLASPTNGSGGQPLSLLLSWGGVAAASSYEVEISSSKAFGTTLFDQSGGALTSVLPGGLATGTTYYWRANASNAGGTTWAGVWSFTTIVAPPAPPALASPTNGAGNEPLSPGLTWGSAAGATTYGVQVSTDVNFGSTVYGQSGIVGLAAPVSGLQNNVTYYWRANAANSGGESWSGVWSFSTVPTAPSAPVLASPSNGAPGEASALIMSWNSVSGAIAYTVQVSTVSTFATIFSTQTGSLPIAAVSNLAYGLTYYWRAGAANGVGTGWSAAWSFATLAAPSAPSLVSPSNAAIFANGLPLTATWGSSAAATAYVLEVSPDSAFSVITLFQSGLSATSFQFTPTAGIPNYWRVAALNAAGTTWSAAAILIPSTAVRKSVLPSASYAFSTREGLIAYSLPKPEQVEISVYDMLGRTALTVTRRQAQGSYSVNLKAGGLAAGGYIVRFKAGTFEKQSVIMLNR
jgi:hypothetical protein